MAEEERPGLTDFRCHVPIELRHSLGVEFLRFESEHLTGTGVQPVDLNVDEYAPQTDEAGRLCPQLSGDPTWVEGAGLMPGTAIARTSLHT